VPRRPRVGRKKIIIHLLGLAPATRPTSRRPLGYGTTRLFGRPWPHGNRSNHEEEVYGSSLIGCFTQRKRHTSLRSIETNYQTWKVIQALPQSHRFVRSGWYNFRGPWQDYSTRTGHQIQPQRRSRKIFRSLRMLPSRGETDTRWTGSVGIVQEWHGDRGHLSGRRQYRINRRSLVNGYVCDRRSPFPNLGRNLFPSAEVFSG
jgi:hypothetical protein